jgi:uncharacterized protein (DUF697 family)
MKKLVVASVGMFATVGILALAPAAAQWRGDRAGAAKASTITVAPGASCQQRCIQRQIRKADPVSGVRITQGDAERFCNSSRRSGC